MSQNKTVLCVDPSSSHLAYTFINIENGEAEITECGMLWTKSTWSRGQKFDYVFQCLDYLINKHSNTPYHILSESFFSTPGMMSGSSSIPTINDYMCMLASRDSRMTFDMIPPTQWRSILGIKPIKDANNKRDYKTPTKDYVEKIIGKLPEEIKSNIMLRPRTTPTDIADSLAIAMAYCKKEGISKIALSRMAFLPFTLIDELHKISKTI